MTKTVKKHIMEQESKLASRPMKLRSMYLFCSAWNIFNVTSSVRFGYQYLIFCFHHLQHKKNYQASLA